MNKASLSSLFSIVLSDYIQRKEEHRMERIFEHYLRHGEEPAIRQVLNQAMPYIDESFEGEAILSVGKSIDFIHKGASGIINAMPFTCMPGTISSAIMKLIQSKYDVPCFQRGLRWSGRDQHNDAAGSLHAPGEGVSPEQDGNELSRKA